MKFLLDTHTLLWILDDELKIPAATRSLLRKPDNQLFVSVVSIWEVVIKRSLGKLSINHSTQRIVDELPKLTIALLPVLTSHVMRVETLPFHHRDPFDRIIIAQALVDNLIIVSKDSNFPLYPIEVFWN